MSASLVALGYEITYSPWKGVRGKKMSDTPRTDAPICEAGRALLEWVDTPGVEPRLSITLRSGAERIVYLERELAEQKRALSDSPKWRDVDSDPPANEQKVLAGWFGSSCTEGMETLTYYAADAPDSGDVWEDVYGECRDKPTHWTIVEGPK